MYLSDYTFTPSQLTIFVGQTVAFVNAEGTHNVDGTAVSNPAPFFLEETEGNIEGVCMGTVTFDVPGTYTFSSSVGSQDVLLDELKLGLYIAKIQFEGMASQRLRFVKE